MAIIYDKNGKILENGRVLDAVAGKGDIALKKINNDPSIRVIAEDFTYEIMSVGKELAADIFDMGGLSIKLIGVISCFIWTFVTAFIMFKLISMTIGLRVSAAEETEGLYLSGPGGNAYPDFDTSSYAQQ